VATKVSERIRWGVDVLDVQPSDRILEIGCGHGVAVSLVCERLTDGRITAVDRSDKMIAAATARNARCVAAGTAEIVRGAFPDLDLGDRRFAKVFAIHVPLFRGDRHAASAALRRLLVPGGAVYLIAQPLHAEDAEPWARSTVGHFVEGGFDVRAPMFSDDLRARMVCVSATLGG
jgi:ubiquinone/menaquinone biosynthesis C-methylase UbiE